MRRGAACNKSHHLDCRCAVRMLHLGSPSLDTKGQCTLDRHLQDVHPNYSHICLVLRYALCRGNLAVLLASGGYLEQCLRRQARWQRTWWVQRKVPTLEGAT